MNVEQERLENQKVDGVPRVPWLLGSNNAHELKDIKLTRVNRATGEKNEGNQRDKEGYRSADRREAVEVESEETKRLKRGSVAVRTFQISNLSEA
jgi:hypothetical protein